MSNEYCKFCASPPKHTFRGEVTRFECGSWPNAKRPGGRACWEGFVMKLQERIEALEAATRKPRPRTVREAAIAGGWHPEIKKPRAPAETESG